MIPRPAKWFLLLLTASLILWATRQQPVPMELPVQDTTIKEIVDAVEKPIPTSAGYPQGWVLKCGDEIMIRLEGGGPDGKEVVECPTISAEGLVAIPVLGVSVPAAGLSCRQLTNAIETAYRTWEFKFDAKVTITLPLGIRGDLAKVVSVGGEVVNSGEFLLRRGMTLSAAIQHAGGFNEWAKSRRVKLFRGTEALEYDLSRPMPDGANNPRLKDGDEIVVLGE